MSINKNIIIKQDINEIVNERSRIWMSYDDTLNHLSNLNSFSGQLESVKAQKFSKLSETGTPPDEIRLAALGLEKEMQKIRTAEANIQKYENEIGHIKGTFITVSIIAAMAGLIIFVILFS